ncbi:MAG: Nif11-like leader peptide family RiPP precursor [Oscillospiraceae bacterium]|nr:Nif11-like leader peptide family RiPP precursor [Oscillospiraceae bacterium]
MNQMKAFIEKARNDSKLAVELTALGITGAEPDEIVAVAAEHGFTITAEDLRQAATGG